jgi:hypothetical protein
MNKCLNCERSFLIDSDLCRRCKLISKINSFDQGKETIFFLNQLEHLISQLEIGLKFNYENSLEKITDKNKILYANRIVRMMDNYIEKFKFLINNMELGDESHNLIPNLRSVYEIYLSLMFLASKNVEVACCYLLFKDISTFGLNDIDDQYQILINTYPDLISKLGTDFPKNSNDFDFYKHIKGKPYKMPSYNITIKDMNLDILTPMFNSIFTREDRTIKRSLSIYGNLSEDSHGNHFYSGKKGTEKYWLMVYMNMTALRLIEVYKDKLFFNFNLPDHKFETLLRKSYKKQNEIFSSWEKMRKNSKKSK